MSHTKLENRCVHKENLAVNQDRLNTHTEKCQVLRRKLWKKNKPISFSK